MSRQQLTVLAKEPFLLLAFVYACIVSWGLSTVLTTAVAAVAYRLHVLPEVQPCLQ